MAGHYERAPEEERIAMEALSKEMQNAKPRREIFLPLMKTTFSLRRHYVLHDASSVTDILSHYTALKECSAVCNYNVHTT